MSDGREVRAFLLRLVLVDDAVLRPPQEGGQQSRDAPDSGCAAKVRVVHQAPGPTLALTQNPPPADLRPDSSPGFRSTISVQDSSQDSSPVVQSCLLSGRPVSVFLAGHVPPQLYL